MKLIVPFLLTLVMTPLLSGLINSLMVRGLFLFTKTPEDKISIKSIFIDSKLSFILLLPVSYLICFYLIFYFYSTSDNTFFQPARIELIYLSAFLIFISLILNLFISAKVVFYQNEIVILKENYLAVHRVMLNFFC